MTDVEDPGMEVAAPEDAVGAVGLVAVVLAGGRGSRLDGAIKARLEVGGRTLLSRALDAVAAAGEVVVVGEEEPTPRRVRFTVEEPRYGGPVAAVRAGLDALPAASAETATRVVVLAVDMPHVSAATVRRLVAAVGRAGVEGAEGAGGSDGAVLVGSDGRRQLALALRHPALVAALPAPEEATGMPLHRLLEGLHLVEVPAEGGEARDVDTWDDLRALRGDGGDW